MKITRANYEPFFLDYLEGNLEENMIDQFLDFLANNPDLKEELHLFENIRLPEDQVVFSGKEQLYKSSSEAKVPNENKTIAYLEGDLDSAERALFETYLADHPELQKEYRLFSKTKLQPDTKIIYQDKNKLYKKSGTAVFLNWTARAAAVLVLLWGISSVIRTGNQPVKENQVQVIAEVNTKPKTQPDKNVAKVPEFITPEKQKPADENKNRKADGLNGASQNRKAELPHNDQLLPERDLTTFAQLSPINAELGQLAPEISLAIAKSIPEEKITNQKHIMTIEEYLASRAKKVSSEGLLSAQRIARVGLNLASELSGERIGYKLKDGKISSVDFESKLLAFSIPLEKK
jgi:hypothetical protein